MKRKRYTEEQIIRILHEIEAGKTVAETCREYNVSESIRPSPTQGIGARKCTVEKDRCSTSAGH